MTTSRSQEWSTILDNIQASLARALAEVEAREQAFAAEEQTAPVRLEHDEALRDTLAQVADHMLLFQSCLGQAGDSAASAEAALLDSERAIQNWLTAAEATRQQLAGAGPRRV